MKHLTKQQVLCLHEQLLAQTGGNPGVRDEGLLEAALAAPFQSYDGQLVYPSLAGQAARLGFGLVQNHPFVDGNKRVGAHVMLVFLALNGMELVYTQQELADLFLGIAAGRVSCEEVSLWITEHQE